MPQPVDPVDQYIQRLAAEKREIAQALRAIIRRAGKNLHESIRWGYPCYVGVDKICSIVPYRHHVNLAFFRGAQLADPGKLLAGTGKAMQHVKITSAAAIPKRALAALVRSAIALDESSGDP